MDYPIISENVNPCCKLERGGGHGGTLSKQDDSFLKIYFQGFSVSPDVLSLSIIILFRAVE